MFSNKKDRLQTAELDALNRSQAVIHFTPDGTIIHANENFLNAMGYTLAEIKGQHHRMFCDPTYAASDDYAEFWRTLARGKYSAAQFKRIAKNRAEIWIEASYNPILDSSGTVIGVVKYATDITKQKLQFSDFQGQLAAIDRAQAVIHFNMDGTIIDANDNFLNVMGYSLSEITGKHHSMFAEPEYAQSPEYKDFWVRLNRGECFVDEFQRYGKNGKEVWISASYNPIKDMNGKEQRNINWSQARARYTVSHGVKTPVQLDELIAFFRARQGRAIGFRFKDWTDYQAVGQNLGTGNGSLTQFQLVKKYTSGTATVTRPILKPVNNATLKVYLNAVLQSSGYTVNYTTGIITFSTPPGAGVVVTADFEFDVPVRFDTDHLDPSIDDFGSRSWESITLLELK